MIGRKIAVMLIALALGGALVACDALDGMFAPAATPSPTPAPTATPEPALKELLFVQPGQEVWENPALNAALKPQGIQLKLQKYPQAQYADKLQLLTAGGVALDLFSLTPAIGNIDDAVRMNLVSAFTPAEGLRSQFSDVMWQNATAAGKIYGVPVRYKEPNGFDYLLAYRTEPLEQAGYESFPQEYLTDAFTEIQSVMTPEGQTPTAFTWLGSEGALPLWLHRSYVSWPFSADNFMHLVKVDAEGVVSSYYESPQFKEDCRTYSRFYNAGLVSDAIAGGPEADALAAGNILPSQGITDSTAAIADLAFVDMGEGPAYVTSLGDTFVCLAKTTKNPTQALEFVQWLYETKENYELFHYGSLGTDYTLDSAGRITQNGAPIVEEALTGYRPYMRYGTAVPQTYIDAITNLGTDAVLAKSALFRFDATAVAEHRRQLEDAVRTYIYPIQLGLVSYSDNIDAAIEKLCLAGLRAYIAEYDRQYQAYLGTA